MTALVAVFALAMGASEWFGGPYGGGPGRVSSERDGTNEYARLVKDRGPGATQLQPRRPVEVGAARHVKVSFLHRGAGGSFRWRLERRNDKGRYAPVKNSAGSDFAEHLSFNGADGWTLHEKTFVVPNRLVHAGNAVSVKFDVWGGNEPRTLDVRGVKVEPIREEAPRPAPAPVKIALEMSPKDEGFGPVPFIWRPDAAIKDGLLLRKGKPFFWVGNGCDLGASQSTSVGLWAAKLLGYTVVSLNPQGELALVKDDGANATIRATANLAGVSHFREAARLGFFIDHFGNGNYKWSPLKKFAEAHPDFKEIHYNHGHYIDIDTGHPLGLDLQTAKREAYFRYVHDVPGVAEMELCREPGPEPSNERARRGFRAWARRKYGTLDEACRTWRRTYATWDDVIPMHLEESDVRGYMARILQGRRAKAEFPAMHYDWLQYLQDDYTACVAAERERLRERLPGLPVTIDVRGHGMDVDTYCVLDPERIDPLMDLFSIHFGAHSYTYGSGMPYHLPSLLDQTSFPLFSYNFFRTNTEKPIFNSEDIIATARIPGSDGAAMEANDIAGLHASPWKFRLESAGEDGLAKGWQAKDLNDSGWDEMKVPGCWDETDRYSCKPGVAWYRKRFVARANRLDWEDGSHTFNLYGKGIAQSGVIWLNGEKVGEVKGWDRPYRFDVSALLDYGRENELVVRVDGRGFQNGLRFYCHILANDKINREERFGAKQYRMMLWPYLMQGTVGCWVWSWHNDYARPYFPSLVKKLEVASEVVLPDLRSRRGDVAYLYGFLSGRGLPCTIVGNHVDYLNWYNAIEFSGVRPDVFGERHFVREIDPSRHRLLVVPFTKYVADETYEAFKRYVLAGGTAVVTEGSLEKTFTRYRDTDIREFAGIDKAAGRKVVETRRGGGKVVFVAGHPQMEELMEILRPYLPKAQISVASAETRERPLIERVFAGSPTRKVLYLANWGGFDHDLTVRIPEGFAGWRMTPLEGSFDRDSATGAFRVKVPSQDVAAVLLEAPSVVERVETDIPAAWRAAVDRNAALNEERDTGKPKVLFPIHHKTVDPVGKELYPYILDRIAAFGCEPKSVRIDEWTPELLAGCPLVVLPETNTKPFYRKPAKEWRPFRKMLADYVSNGGSLFFIAHTAWEVNNYAKLLDDVTPEFGIVKRWETPRDPRHSGFGDPGQVVGEAVAGTPIADGVRRVQLYRMHTLSLKGAAKAVVRIPSDAEKCAGACAMAAVEVGKGRVFVSADAMAFQPFRIGEVDNAALLENVVGWLLGKPVTQEMRDEFKANLFLTEKTFQGNRR